jgi:hypothetical protein
MCVSEPERGGELTVQWTAERGTERKRKAIWLAEDVVCCIVGRRAGKLSCLYHTSCNNTNSKSRSLPQQQRNWFYDEGTRGQR